MIKTRAYLALGSNVGDRPATLLAALKMLADQPQISVCRVSQFITTDPVGPEGQGKYLNAAAEIETTLSPQELLAAMGRVECALGRDRQAEQRWGPRTCDLDLLLFGAAIVNTAEVTVPHPRMHERLFVLQPLAQIAAEAVHPVLGKTVRRLLDELEQQE